MPKISVIMPIYNTKREYLVEAIDSVLQQTYTDFELLLIDDGSSVDIEGIVSAYSDSRIKYFKLLKNHGAAYARNFGIKKSSGEFIAFLDSDDIALPERFNIQVCFFENNQTVDCVGSDVLIIPEGKKLQFPIQHDDIIIFLLFKGCAFTQSSVMIRKKILIEHNIYYKEEYVPSEDYAFWLDLIGYTNFANINEILVKYRWHGSNISIEKAEIQQSLSKKAKIQRLLNLVDFSTEKNVYKAMSNFMEYPTQFSLSELPLIELFIPAIVAKMLEMGFDEEKVLHGFRKNFTKLIRKTPSKTIARKLCFSSLSKFLKLGTDRQLFYYITKGLF